MPFPELRDALETLLPVDERPIVAYTALWPLAPAYRGARETLVEACREELLEIAGARTIVLPAYTGGYRDGFLDLDREPGTTGILNESIRRMPGTRRTASAFFSFVARGPEAEALARLRPAHAWGEGSLFEWLHERDARILLLGARYSSCSFLHRVEWLAKVPYRYPKEFSGELLVGGRRERLIERLYVRSLDPLAENDWSPAGPAMEAAGLARAALGRGETGVIGARALVDALRPLAERDPFAFVKRPEALRAAFAPRPA
ncbi:MAG: AAC(3) family N-acetyltransferase [Elusimicrobia bacterium]|nr:AAC(3) family N-acetyltransferase [Elusimicrobiota bacterium]